MKTFRGTIKDVELHTISSDIEKAKKVLPDLNTDAVYRFTAIVVDDPTGRMLPGWHMTSSVVLSIDKGTITTKNSTYKFNGEITKGHLGPLVDSIFY